MSEQDKNWQAMVDAARTVMPLFPQANELAHLAGNLLNEALLGANTSMDPTALQAEVNGFNAASGYHLEVIKTTHGFALEQEGKTISLE